MKHTTPKPKKPLYFGMTDTGYTMCVKKMRRHRELDVRWSIFPPAEEGGKIDVKPYCKHCKGMPFEATKPVVS